MGLLQTRQMEARWVLLKSGIAYENSWKPKIKLNIVPRSTTKPTIVAIIVMSLSKILWSVLRGLDSMLYLPSKTLAEYRHKQSLHQISVFMFTTCSPSPNRIPPIGGRMGWGSRAFNSFSDGVLADARLLCNDTILSGSITKKRLLLQVCSAVLL